MAVFWTLVGVLTGSNPSGTLVGTGAAAAVLLLTVLAAGMLLGRRPRVLDSRIAGESLRDRAGRIGVPRHRDPDAAGRTRPRGPTHHPAAA